MRVGAAMDCTERHEEVFGEKQNIGAALAERRNRQQQNIQPEKKILAEAAGLDGSGEIHIGEGDEASFDAQRFGSAEAFEGPLLQDAQQLALRPCRKSSDLVENNCAAAAEFESAEFAFDSAGESAALVAEEFALHEIWRKAGAINLQKWRIAARAEFVHEAREVVFARAAFAGDQQSCRGDGDFLGKFQEAKRCGVLGDPR
jgi:hypothetical protein